MKMGGIMNIFKDVKEIIKKNPKIAYVSSIVFNYCMGMNYFRYRKKENKIVNDGAFLKKCKIHIKGIDNLIVLGEKDILQNSQIYIKGNNNKVILYNNVGLKNCEVFIEDNNNLLEIGEGTQICGNTKFACIEGKNIIIGKDCLFSSDITFRTGDSHSILEWNGTLDKSMIQKRVNPSGNIIIGDRVWIGNSVIILKNTEIQHDSVIGTGAVVTKAFGCSNIVIGGNPARIIKRNISWIHKRI